MYLLTRIIQPERNTGTNSQYSGRETIKLNPVHANITEDVLEENIFQALSLTRVNVVCNDLHTCHRMKRLGRVIVRFKCRKQKNSVMYKRKNPGNKSQKLSNLKFSGRLFLNESMSRESR